MQKKITVPESLEQEYQECLDPVRITSGRINSILGIILFLCMIFLDHIVIPSSIVEAHLLKGVAIASLLFTFISTHFPFYLKHYQKLVPIAYLIPAFSVEYTIYLSKNTELAFFLLFPTLIIIIMLLCLWTHITFTRLVITIALILFGFINAVISHEEIPSFYSVKNLLIVSFFLINGAVLAGIVGRIMRDNILRQNFLLQHSLNNEVEKLEFYSNHDQLTGLANRRFAEKIFKSNLNTIKEKESKFVLLFLDLNGFKHINDTYGHDAGDEVLRVVSKRLKQCTRKSDDIIRLGGDEFLVSMIIEKHDKLTTINTCANIKECITWPIKYNGDTLTISTSIGTASYPEDGEDLESLIQTSDKNMYKNKQKSKKLELWLKTQAS